MPYVPGQLANSAKSTVTTTALTASSNSITLASGDGVKFPQTGPFLVVVYTTTNGVASDWEFMQVGSVSGDTLNGVVRGQPGPFDAVHSGGVGPRAWGTGSTVELVNVGVGDLFNVGARIATPILTGNAAQALAASGTIATAALGVSVTNPGAACTGVIMAPGTTDGQTCIVVNTHASNGITMAAAGTSNVADGTSDTIAALTAALYVWNATAARWFRVKAA